MVKLGSYVHGMDKSPVRLWLGPPLVKRLELSHACNCKELLVALKADYLL